MTIDMTRGTVRVRVPEILAERKLTISELMRGTGLAYNTASAWARGYVDRYDAKTLAALCEYFELEPGDILVYVSQDDTVTAQ
jgi:putative transcriptional regulator